MHFCFMKNNSRYARKRIFFIFLDLYLLGGNAAYTHILLRQSQSINIEFCFCLSWMFVVSIHFYLSSVQSFPLADITHKFKWHHRFQYRWMARKHSVCTPSPMLQFHSINYISQYFNRCIFYLFFGWTTFYGKQSKIFIQRFFNFNWNIFVNRENMAEFCCTKGMK